MPALNIDKDDLRDKGYIKVLSGKDYLTVAGRLYLAHGSGQLVGIETRELYPEDDKFLTIDATARVFNVGVLTEIERVAANEAIPAEAKLSIIYQLIHSGLVGTYTGQAQSKRTGGKSAEGSNPRETAETSAVGRALGQAGFGDTESFASFEEMAVAESRRPVSPNGKKVGNKPTAAQKTELFELAKTKLGIATKEELAESVEGVTGKKLEDLTSADVDGLIAELRGDAEGGEPGDNGVPF